MLTDIGLATKQSWQFWQSWQQNQSWGLLLTQLLPPFASAGKTLANGRKHSTCWTAINICQQRLPLDQNFSPFVLVFAPFLLQQLLICLLFFDQGNASSILCPVACVSACVRLNVSSAGPRLASLTCVPCVIWEPMSLQWRTHNRSRQLSV